MLLNFKDMEEVCVPNVFDGEGDFFLKNYEDDAVQALCSRLVPGASVGAHTHTEDCELCYCIAGTGKAIIDGEEEIITPGTCHYCPINSNHTIINTGDEDMYFFCVCAK